MIVLQILGVSVLAGATYPLLRVRSPAPPPVAIVGLAGMLLSSSLLGLIP